MTFSQGYKFLVFSPILIRVVLPFHHLPHFYQLSAPALAYAVHIKTFSPS